MRRSLFSLIGNDGDPVVVKRAIGTATRSNRSGHRRWEAAPTSLISAWRLLKPSYPSTVQTVARRESIVTSDIAYEESSREWAGAYVVTNQMLADLHGRLAGFLEAAGYRASNLPPT